MDRSCAIDIFSSAPQYSVTASEFAEGPFVATHFTNREAIEALKDRTKTLSAFIGGAELEGSTAGLSRTGT